jgi:hypothetical protein
MARPKQMPLLIVRLHSSVVGVKRRQTKTQRAGGKRKTSCYRTADIEGLGITSKLCLRDSTGLDAKGEDFLYFIKASLLLVKYLDQTLYVLDIRSIS